MIFLNNPNQKGYVVDTLKKMTIKLGLEKEKTASNFSKNSINQVKYKTNTPSTSQNKSTTTNFERIN
jgi:hypothetical protein